MMMNPIPSISRPGSRRNSLARNPLGQHALKAGGRM